MLKICKMKKSGHTDILTLQCYVWPLNFNLSSHQDLKCKEKVKL